MITWLAAKAWLSVMWKSFIEFCKERWELLVGVVVGILGMLALTRSNRDMGKVLDEKNLLRNKEDEAVAKAREAEDAALKENLSNFFKRDEVAKKEYTEKLKGLDDDAKARVKELLESDNPEDKIAQGLRDYLG